MRISDWSSDVCSSDLVLGVEMVVETALGDVQFARDPLHRGAAIAEFVDQPRRRAQELLASRLGLIVFEVDQIGRPLLARCGDAVREQIGRASWRERGVQYV